MPSLPSPPPPHALPLLLSSPPPPAPLHYMPPPLGMRFSLAQPLPPLVALAQPLTCPPPTPVSSAPQEKEAAEALRRRAEEELDAYHQKLWEEQQAEDLAQMQVSEDGSVKGQFKA